MANKYRVTVESIVDGRSEKLIVEEYEAHEFTYEMERFLDANYEVGDFNPSGFWDKGNKMVITGLRLKNPPELI